MTDDARMTVGQAFAARWIARNYSHYQAQGSPEDLFEKISKAVDGYVEKQRMLFLSRLRDVAVKAADGESANGNLSFTSDDILKDSELVKVAERWGSPFTSQTIFPVS